MTNLTQDELLNRIAALEERIAEQEKSLREEQERFQVLTENMREGLILIGDSGAILSCNTAALELLGIDVPDESATVYDLNHAPSFLETVRNAVNGIHGEATLYLGETVCQLIANPITNGSMKSGAVLVLMDITEREKRDALRREFTSNVSHELKTPLTSIYGIADMLESGMVKSVSAQNPPA